MTITRRTTLREVALTVGHSLARNGIRAILTGGACASIHAGGRYLSEDVDFVLEGPVRIEDLDAAMAAIGYARDANRYVHSRSRFWVEFPRGPLAVGGDLDVDPAAREPSSEHAPLAYRLLSRPPGRLLSLERPAEPRRRGRDRPPSRCRSRADSPLERGRGARRPIRRVPSGAGAAQALRRHGRTSSRHPAPPSSRGAGTAELGAWPRTQRRERMGSSFDRQRFCAHSDPAPRRGPPRHVDVHDQALLIAPAGPYNGRVVQVMNGVVPHAPDPGLRSLAARSCPRPEAPQAKP